MIRRLGMAIGLAFAGWHLLKRAAVILLRRLDDC